MVKNGVYYCVNNSDVNIVQSNTQAEENLIRDEYQSPVGLRIIDIKKNAIYFFDSVGRKAPKQVKKFIKNVIKQSELLGKKMGYDELYNHKIEHQYQDTECGMYSLYFIINMLNKKKSWKHFCNNKISDTAVSKFRNIYFNKDL